MRGKTEGASLVLTPAERWWVGGWVYLCCILLAFHRLMGAGF